MTIPRYLICLESVSTNSTGGEQEQASDVVNFFQAVQIQVLEHKIKTTQAEPRQACNSSVVVVVLNRDLVNEKIVCPSCDGSGTRDKNDVIECKVCGDRGSPKGYEELFEGKGDKGPKIDAGDVVLRIKILRHSRIPVQQLRPIQTLQRPTSERL
ncbi:hypothetical protein BY996DRAFT_8424992 [Phakopsora pachyrhizi]|nr:hypothetical protein BY996DRAFT_8424992 [Phakopsora pachyrhizi]